MSGNVRELPNNVEAEQAILGAMLIYPKVVQDVYDHNLERDDFFLDIHRRIYSAMLYLIDNGKPIDPTTLVARLQDNEELHLVGGADYIVSLSNSPVTSANVTTYIDIVQSKAYARNLIETAEKIAEEGFDTSNELDTLMDEAERSILDVTRRRKATNFKSSRNVIMNVLDELARIRSTNDRITGTRTGYVDLDNITNGFQRGDLIILAARPSMGKTAFALNLALRSAERNPGAVAYFSLEMPAEQLMRRLLSAKSEIEGKKIQNGDLKTEEMNRINESANEMAMLKLFIDDSASVKMPDVFSKCRKLKSEHNLDLVVIDYLQLITSTARHAGENRQQEVSDISRSLKALARELEVPVIALSQLSRSVESRSDKHPMMSDLRESGAIEQDADIVMFLYREDYYRNDKGERIEEDSVETEVDLQKHRNGKTGTVKLQFTKSVNAFYNIRREQ